VPQLERYPDAELDGEFLLLGDRVEMAEPPPELYLRQAQRLDAANPGPIALEIARTVGGIYPADAAVEGPHFQHEWQVEWAANEPRDLPHAPRPIELAGGKKKLFGSPYGTELFSSMQQRHYAPTTFVGRGAKVHIDEIAYRLHVLSHLGRHAVAYRRGDYLVPAWSEMLGPPIDGERQAWDRFRQMIDPAIDVFHVRVLLQSAEGQPVGEKRLSFLEVGALQIVNDLVDEVDYLTCPNCGLIFARQVGRSTHYSRRIGVTYCSPSCATAARVKAYRARKRAERTS
jgi:predicted RNA-binding Zn-ribbon protein involved in translation (DUF1610 family)